MLRSILRTTFVLAIFVLTSSRAFAQDGAVVNRSIDNVRFAPDPAGGTLVITDYTFGVADSTADVNMNADFVIAVNGVVVETVETRSSWLVSGPLCPTNCIESECGGGPFHGKCSDGGDPPFTACACLAKDTYAENLTLRDGDLVTVSYTPARGGVAESFTGDDSMEVVYEGDPTGDPNRTILYLLLLIIVAVLAWILSRRFQTAG